MFIHTMNWSVEVNLIHSISWMSSTPRDDPLKWGLNLPSKWTIFQEGGTIKCSPYTEHIFEKDRWMDKEKWNERWMEIWAQGQEQVESCFQFREWKLNIKSLWTVKSLQFISILRSLRVNWGINFTANVTLRLEVIWYFIYTFLIWLWLL